MVLAVALPCSWLVVETRAARKQKEVLAAITESGMVGWVGYDYNFDQSLDWQDADLPASEWLRRPLGDDFFAAAVFISFRDTPVGDSVLEHLSELTTLHGLDLRNTKVTDGGLERLKGQVGLRSLELPGTQVTDAGVAKLQQALPNCKITR